MSDPRRPEHYGPAEHGAEPTEQLRLPHPDPAGRSPYAPGADPSDSSPTEKIPQYWQGGAPAPDQPTAGPSPTPGRGKPPRWLWIAATAAVLLVVGLVVALVINGSATKKTAVPPLSTTPNSTTPASTTTSPSSTEATSSAEPTESSQPANAGPTETVAYKVTGDGRAISITYLDNGGVTQTEFNVALPWSKEVSLPTSGNRKAQVTITNIGHDVTCSVSVAGAEVRQHTGVGLTVCDAAD